MDKLLKVLSQDSLEIELGNNTCIILKLVNDSVLISKKEYFIEKNILKSRIFEEYYPSRDELESIIEKYQEYIELKYNEIIEVESKITESYEDITSYLIESVYPKDKKEIILEIINFVYKYGAFNISEDYGLTNIEPFSKKVGYVLINLKDMKCIYEYEDMFNTIIDEIRRKRPTFQKIYDKNMEEFSRKC